MKTIINETLKYFRPPQNYFWRWSENGEVIEWSHGKTICYREDLIPILRELSKDGLPPLGAVLLILAACQKNWNESEDSRDILDGILKHLLENGLGRQGFKLLNDLFKNATSSMKVISEVDELLRKGESRKHLVCEILKNTTPRLQVNLSESILDNFESGNFDDLIFPSENPVNSDYYKNDLRPLAQAFSKFQNKTLLENYLRTGVMETPEPAEVEIPEEETPVDLLAQLAEDSKTAGVARLTQRLIAALHIPMHTSGTSDQSYGGVSDITNRGDFDKLLLSELAHDDLSLMARLVNNEALYFHHEEPPVQLNQQRTILIDSTIKLWGLPRVFAISAALACSQNNKHDIPVKAFSLGGKNFTEVNLETKQGVLQTLEQLDTSLNCNNALTSFFEENKKQSRCENILITEETMIKSETYLTNLTFYQEHLDFLITINRQGDLHFYQYSNGKRKLLTKTKFDLNELLFPVEKKKPNKKTDQHLPAIMNEDLFPIYFPTTGMRLKKGNTFSLGKKGIIGINEKQRLLYWPREIAGAIELVSCLELGSHYFGFHESNAFLVIINTQTGLFKLYHFQLDAEEVCEYNFDYDYGHLYLVKFWENYFYLRTEKTDLQIDGLTGEMVYAEKGYFNNQESATPHRIDFIASKNFINNGYTALQRSRKVFINKSGRLSVGALDILLKKDGKLWLEKYSGDFKLRPVFATPSEATFLTGNLSVPFTTYTWQDGSLATVDSRGFLHLKSSDKTLPEITIVLIVGKTDSLLGFGRKRLWFGLFCRKKSFGKNAE